jgi:hypothetical protein
VKAAAAVLGASLLFFLGVLTGTGRRESIPPPVAIPLGVVDESASDGPAPTPTGPSRPPAPVGTTSTTAPAATTSTTARPGEVEEVDAEVDCSRGNGQGKGGREPCPTTTTTGQDEGRPGGGNNR